VNLSLPKTTTPTLSVSKFRDIPLTPEENSTISPACTFCRPNTLAIPSPILMTVPYSFMSFIYEILDIFYSKATVASPIPNFLDDENALLIIGLNFLNLLSI
jgi:hypothetical protein